MRSAARVARRHGQHDDRAGACARAARPSLTNGRAGRHHRLEVRAIGDVQRAARGEAAAGGAQARPVDRPSRGHPRTALRPAARCAGNRRAWPRLSPSRARAETGRSRSVSRAGRRSTSRSSRWRGSLGHGRCPRRSAARRRTAGGRGRPRRPRARGPRSGPRAAGGGAAAGRRRRRPRCPRTPGGVVGGRTARSRRLTGAGPRWSPRPRPHGT